MDLLAEMRGSGEGRSYEKYVTALRQQRALKDEAHITEYNLSVLEKVATYTLTTAPNMDLLPAFTQYGVFAHSNRHRRCLPIPGRSWLMLVDEVTWNAFVELLPVAWL